MFLDRFKRKPTLLERVIDTTLASLADAKEGTEEHTQLTEVLVKLYKMQEIDTSHRIDPNTVLTVAGSVLGILLIISHERAHVVTSKALGFVLKLR